MCAALDGDEEVVKKEDAQKDEISWPWGKGKDKDKDTGKDKEKDKGKDKDKDKDKEKVGALYVYNVTQMLM